MLPESPMKMLAGWKLKRRNPSAMPTTMIAIRGAAGRSPRPPVEASSYVYTKKDEAAIAQIPAAKPSRPSTRLTALIMATSQKTVTKTETSSLSEMLASPGTRMKSILMPDRNRIPEANT